MRISNLQPEYVEKSQTIILKINRKIAFNERLLNYVKGLNLTPKSEFHFTLIGTDTSEKILQICKYNQNLLAEKIKELYDITVNLNWEAELEDKYYFLKKSYPEYPDLKGNPEKRETIVQLAKLNNIGTFYKKLNLKCNSNFPIPFSHLTLFSTSSIPEKIERGIGVYSLEDFKSLNPIEIQI